MPEPIPASPATPVQFTDPETGLVGTKHDGQVWFKAGGSYFSADSIQQGLEHDSSAELATPDEVTHRLAVRAQDTTAGGAKIFTKNLAAHTFDVATGLIRYPAMGAAALLDDQQGLNELQQLGGQQVMENVYGLYNELVGGRNQEAAGREYGEATRAQNEANPGSALAGGIAGDVAPILATGGLAAAGRLPGKLVSESIAEHTIGSLGTGLAPRIGAKVVAGAIQGVSFGEQAASEAAYLQNEPLTRQKLWASGAMGGLFGGAISGGAGLAGAGFGAARTRLSDVLGRVAKPVPKGSLAEAIGDSTVTKEAAQDVADRVMASEGVPAAPGLGEKLHSLLTDVQAATSDGERSAIDQYGIGAILDPKTRVKALSGIQIFKDRPIIIEKATGEIADSMAELEKHAGGTVFESVRDLGMKRNAWEKLVDPAKRGEQVDAARALLAETQERLEGMLPQKAEAASMGPIPADYEGLMGRVESQASKAERDAINDYTTTSYKHMNDALRDAKKYAKQWGPGMTAEKQIKARALESALEKQVAAGNVYRGEVERVMDLPRETIDDWLSTGSVSNDSFWSTTADPEAMAGTTGGKLRGNVRLHITNSDAVPIGRFSKVAAEKEAVIPRDRTFFVDRHEARDGVDHIWLEQARPTDTAGNELGAMAAAKSAPRGASGIEVNADAINPQGMRQESLDYLRAHPEEGNRLGPPRIEIWPDAGPKIGDGRHRLTLASERGDKDIEARVVRFDREGNTVSDELQQINLARGGRGGEAVREVDTGEADRLSYGDAARIKSALNHAKRAAKALEGEADGATAAIELDAFKRSLGKLTKGSAKRLSNLRASGDFEADAVFNTAKAFSETYEKTRQLLMNQQLWGKAGQAQSEINAGWQQWIDSRRMYSGSLMRATGERASADIPEFGAGVRYEIDPDKVGSWIDKFGTGRGKLNDEYIRAHIDATENLTKTIGKYVDSGSLGASVQAVKDAAQKIKSNLKVASETVAVANQVQLAGSAHVSAAAKMGMAAAGAMAGGPVGGAAGAALGFLMSPGKVMNAAMAIQGLLSKVDTEKASALRSFFGEAVRTAGSAAKKAETVGEFTAGTTALNESGVLSPPSSNVTRRAIAAAASRSAQFFGSGGQARADQYLKRRDQLAALMSNPDMANHQIQATLGALPGIAPQLASSMAMDAMRNLSLLQQMAPPASPVGGLFGGKRKTFTPDSEIRKFAAQWDGVMNPISVLRDMRTGSLNMDKVEAARAAHPELFSEIAGEFLEKMAELKEPMDPQAARQADLLLGLNGAGDPSTAPDFLARMATLNQADQNDQRSPPAARPPVNLAKGKATLSQSLEGA